jgi:hypothetical protein
MTKEYRPSTPNQLRGKVLAFNFSAKGHVEGVLVETASGLAQVNFPKHDPTAFQQMMRLGSRIDVPAELESAAGDHPVYRAAEAAAETTGTIMRLNFAQNGEVNGYQLEDKTFLHVKADSAKRYQMRVGEKVKATGSRRQGTDVLVVEVMALERLAGKRSDEDLHA